ncbi:hypothetical protein [Lacrimispora sp.]|uniref:hypothetical protein n=1 Tax=Lacrimispora sp. TaxID=2719234 RepID=UPI0028AD3746|nr:hypothetical protein [Lacrimispora sp.]
MHKSSLDTMMYNSNRELFKERGNITAQMKGILYYNRTVKREPEITKQVSKAAEEAGMDMVGTECRIKSRRSYLKKIRRKNGPKGSCYEVKDILRYTYTASEEELVEKLSKVIELYSVSGYNTIEIENYWLDKQNPYNGINTTMQSPEGLTFELQYHTHESFEIKNGKMHELYEKQRLMKDVSSKGYIELGDRMFELSDSMKIPKGIEKVKTHE